MSTEPLRQYPGEDLPQNTRHEVDGDTATDTYHIPGRPLPEDDAAEVPAEDTPVAETSVPPAQLVDVSSPEAVYATKPNIVHPPEDIQVLVKDDEDAPSVAQVQAVELAEPGISLEDAVERAAEPDDEDEVEPEEE